MLVKVGGTEVDIAVECVMSGPRFGPISNLFGWAQAFLPLGIRPTLAQGAFWSQGLTRVFEQFIDSAQYLLVTDFDTYFSREDVEQLVAIAMTFQCDALAPLQVKREDGRPMLTLKGTLDNPPADGMTQLPRSWFGEPVQEVDTAHFGCTIISTTALRRAKKPWFLERPDPQGGWGEGRRDSDIAFWANWRESGNRVFVTPRVCIGHGEWVITWPSKDLGKPVFQYTSDYQKSNKKPETAWSVG
ncbi:hypothetical protein [Limnohabitans sp.]|uniref:hypothetical protein n=1 Tax=Limnohabitans sp. TaxID=1907725 RepID=UPI00333E7F47